MITTNLAETLTAEATRSNEPLRQLVVKILEAKGKNPADAEYRWEVGLRIQRAIEAEVNALLN